MRKIAQHCLGRHNRGDAGPLALVVELPARQNRAPQRTGASELDHPVGDGRAGVEQHASDVVMAPRNRDLERILGGREAPDTRAQGSDDGDMTIGRRVPEGHFPAVVASINSGSTFDQELDNISPGGRRGMQGRETPSVGGRRTGRPGLEEQVKEGRAVNGAEQRWSTNAVETSGGVGIGSNEKLRNRHRRVGVREAAHVVK